MKEGSKKVEVEEEEVEAKQKEMQDAGPVNRLDHVTNSTKKKKHRHEGPWSTRASAMKNETGTEKKEEKKITRPTPKRSSSLCALFAAATVVVVAVPPTHGKRMA
jgi:hypothetical protein